MMEAEAPGSIHGSGATVSRRSRTTFAGTERDERDRLDRLQDDRRVVDAVLGGDRDAFRAVVERESGAVIAACARILGDRADAEDAAQEAFVIAYRSLPTWRADGPLGAWLVRIAVRVALRKAAGRRTVTWLDPRPGVPPLESRPAVGVATAVYASASTADPAVVTLHAERDATLRRAVAQLDEPYREVVALRFFGDRSLNEIAELTDRPLGTVKTHLHRGLARLRAAVEGEMR